MSLSASPKSEPCSCGRSIAAAVLGQSPAVAMASAQQTLAHAASLAAMNAVQAQQQGFISHQAATDRAVAMLYGLIDE